MGDGNKADKKRNIMEEGELGQSGEILQFQIEWLSKVN